MPHAQYLAEQEFFESLKLDHLIVDYHYDAHSETWVITPVFKLNYIKLKLTAADLESKVGGV